MYCLLPTVLTNSCSEQNKNKTQRDFQVAEGDG